LNSLRSASFFAGEATNASPVTITPVDHPRGPLA
jgi:hypothetical protein